MGLVLLKSESVRHPLYIKQLDMYIYSSAELSYVIYHYPLLLMKGFFSRPLFDFIREELDRPHLASQLEHISENGTASSAQEAFLLVLDECEWCSAGAAAEFKKKISQTLKKRPAEISYLAACEMISMGMYGQAASVLKELSDQGAKRRGEERFMAAVLKRLAFVSVRLHRAEEAMAAYAGAYRITRETELAEKMVLITLTEMGSGLNAEDYLGGGGDISALKEKATARMLEARQKALSGDKYKAMSDSFLKASPARRAAAGELLDAWKRNYRKGMR